MNGPGKMPRAGARAREALVLALALAAGSAGCLGQGAPKGWDTSFRKAFSRSQESGKPLLVFFTEEHNDWCRRMETETFRDAEVGRALDGYILVRVSPSKDPLTAGNYEVNLVPSAVIVDHRGEERYHVTGFRTAPQMVRELERARAALAGAAPGGAG